MPCGSTRRGPCRPLPWTPPQAFRSREVGKHPEVRAKVEERNGPHQDMQGSPGLHSLGWHSSLFPSCPPGPWVQLPCLCLECVPSPAPAPLLCECVPGHPHNRASGCCLLPLYRCRN